MYDMIVIGCGPAGMTAAIYAARKQLNLAVISPDVGGQAIWAVDVENYLGYRLISGVDLASKFEDHVRDMGIGIISEKAESLKKKDKAFVVKTVSGQSHEARAVIIASGRSARKLGIPGEEEYIGRGVAYCATCDAPLFAGETVAVVGGGNAGLDAVLQLSAIAKKIYLIESGNKLSGDMCLQEKISCKAIVKSLINTEVVSIHGGNMVEKITVRNKETGETREIQVTGVFIEIGSIPNTGFLPSDVKINRQKEIKIDCLNKTNIPGIFAAGDVTNVPHKQIIIAAGEGSKASLSAYDYLTREFP